MHRLVSIVRRDIPAHQSDLSYGEARSAAGSLLESSHTTHGIRTSAAFKVPDRLLLTGQYVLIIIARTVGWAVHWQEMISDPAMRIGRPRQLYTGAPKRDYLEVGKR